jgi:8-oxo-dGTP diphosphatase
MTVVQSELKVLLTKREHQPFKGTWSLPGDFVKSATNRRQGEDLISTAKRTLKDHFGSESEHCFLEQLHTFGRAGRDPRMRVISVAWCAVVPPDWAVVNASTQDHHARWFSADEEVPWIRLAFDHAEILQMGIERVRDKLDQSTIAFRLLPTHFTVSELREIYEVIKGKRYDPRNFRRRFQRMLSGGIVEETPEKRLTGPSRPARTWRWIPTKS